MFRLLTRVQLAYVGVFFACCIGVFYYEARYVWPVQACEEHGGWWSARYGACATPVPIWQLTGRMPKGWAPIAGRPDTAPQIAPIVRVAPVAPQAVPAAPR